MANIIKIEYKRINLRPYSHLIRTHIKPHLGSYQISKITTQCIEEYAKNLLMDGRLDNDGGLAPKTVTDVLTIVKSSFEYARFMNMTVICNLSRLTIKKEDKEMRVLSISEQRRLTTVLMEEMDLSKFGVLLSLYTGIRIGELCALKWEDICLSQSTLKIRKTMQRIQDNSENAPHKTKVVITEPKSQCSIREIPLTASVIEIARNFSSCPKAYVLSGAVDRFVEPRTMQNRFKAYAKESGIQDVSFHALRHTFATRCVEVGFELKSLSEVLGHANVNITLNRYVHSSFELKSANMNKLDFWI